MAAREVYIAIIGAGGVGQAFLTQLEALRKTWSGLRVSLIARSRVCLWAADHAQGISLSNWTDQLALSQTPTPTPAQLLETLRTNLPPGAARILVDNTATSTWGEAYPAFLEAGVHVITPNKKAFSGEASLWAGIQAASKKPGAGFIYHEASVGAGLPVLNTLSDLLATGDSVQRIEGVFSGTLSFLFNGFAPVSASGQLPAWSASVQNAKELGYTEPDARDDLSGTDVARKLTILARLCGVSVSGPDGFPVQSLVPSELQSVQDPDAFLSRLPEFDAELEKLRKEAEDKGAVLRYVGTLDVAANKLSVGLQHVPRDSPIAALQGADNLIAFHTKRYANRPLVIQGAGAGADVTAMGVAADLIRVLQRLG